MDGKVRTQASGEDGPRELGSDRGEEVSFGLAPLVERMVRAQPLNPFVKMEVQVLPRCKTTLESC